MKTDFRFLSMSAISKIAVAVLMLPLLQSCGDDDPGDDLIWDFMPVDITVFVEDSEGNNLLIPGTPGYINPEDVVVEYGGKTYEYVNTAELEYPCDSYEEPRPGTRATRCIWYGLHEGHNHDDPSLNIGQFRVEDGYYGEQLEIVWPDGSRDKIVFNLFIFWITKKNPKTIKNLYLNGEPVDAIVIRK